MPDALEKKMNFRLLYTSNIDISIAHGPSVNEREFVEALSRKKSVQTTFVIPIPKHPEKCNGLEGVKFYYAGKGHLQFILSQVTHPWALFQEMRKGQVDGIIVRSNLVPLILTWFLGRVSPPVFLKTQGNPTIDWLCSQPGLKGMVSRLIRPVNIWLHKKLFRRASVIDCCTPQLVGSVQLLLPENERNKIIHIENATNPVRFHPMDKKVCRSRLGIESFYPVIGYVGGSPVERGGEQIIHAVARLRDKYPNIAGCVVGGTKHQVESLLKLAKDLEIADRCIIPGVVEYDEVVYWVNSFDVGIAIDTAERLVNIGSSNQKIRQYIACGLPVIAGKGTSLFIEKYGLGALVSSDNQEEFVKAVMNLIDLSPEQKSKIAHNGRELCKKEFSIDAAVQKRLDCWHSAINGDKRNFKGKAK